MAKKTKKPDPTAMLPSVAAIPPAQAGLVLNKLTGKRQSDVRGYTDQSNPKRVSTFAPRTLDPYLPMFWQTGPGLRYGQNPDPLELYESSKKGLPYRWQGGLYKEAYDKDPNLFACGVQLESGVSDGKLLVKPDGNSANAVLAADLARTCLYRIGGDGLDGLIGTLARHILFGIAEVEPAWEVDTMDIVQADGTSGVTREIIWGYEFMFHDPRRFNFTPEGEPLLRTWAKQLGEEIPNYEDRLLIFRPFNEYGNPYGTALLQKVWWYVYVKKAVLKYWFDHAEKFGSPLIFVTPDRPLSNTEMDQAEDAVTNIIHTLGALLPPGAKPETFDLGKSGAGMYHDLIQLLDSQIDRALVGQDFTVQQAEKGGTRSSGEIYADVAAKLFKRYARQVAHFIQNEYVKRLIQWNLGPGYPVPIIEIDTTTTQDRMLLSTMLLNITSSGLKPKISDLADAFAMNFDESDGEWLEPPEPTLPAGADTRPGSDKAANPAKPPAKGKPNPAPQNKAGRGGQAAKKAVSK